MATSLPRPTRRCSSRGRPWWDYAMLLVVIALLAGAAWLAQRNMWVVLAPVVVPVALTIFWRPHSTAGDGLGRLVPHRETVPARGPLPSPSKYS